MHKFDSFKTPHFEFINYTILNECESKIIWEGRNNPDVRKWMTNSDPFSYEEHCKFIQSLKTSENKLFWAVKYCGKIIGAYILNPYNSASLDAELGKFLLPDSRGKGLGKLVTKEFLSFVFDNGILNSICAKTLIENERNQHINELMGFKKIGKDDKYVYMQLNKEDYNG